MKKITKAVLSAVAATTIVASSALAQKQDFEAVTLPATIDIIVASSAGGSSDALVRVTAITWEKKLEELTGQSTSTVVKNMPGAGTEIGATAIAEAEPNGSTIGLMNLPHFPLLDASRETRFNPWLEKFAPIGLNVIDPNVVILGKNSQYESIADAVKAATDNPGSVILGSQGPMSDDQLAMYALEDATGAKFAYIPYPGGSDANRAILGGEIDLTIGNIFDYLQVQDSAKEAAVFATERYSMVSEVATVEELIGAKTGDANSSRGFVAPIGLPNDLLALYREAMTETFADPDYQKEALARNITLVEPLDADQLEDLMVEQQKTVDRLLGYFRMGGFLDN